MWKKAALFSLILLFCVATVSAQDEDQFRDASGIFIASSNFDTDGDGSPDEEPYSDSWGYSQPPNGDPNHYPQAIYGSKLKNKDSGNGYQFGYACVSGAYDWPPHEDCFLNYLGADDGFELTADDWWLDIGEYRISDMIYESDAWVTSNPPGGNYGDTIVGYFEKEGGPYKVPQDLPLPVGTHQTEINVLKDGTTYTNKNGKIEVEPWNAQKENKAVFLYVRMELDRHDDGDPDSVFHNMVLSSYWWDKGDEFHPPSPGIGITAVDQYDADVTSSEGDRYCTYHVKQGFLGGDSGNDELSDLVTSKKECKGETGASANYVKNMDFGTAAARDLKDPNAGGGCTHGCDINQEWGLDGHQGIHDYGRYAPVGELAVGTEMNDDFEWWFICRKSSEYLNISVSGQKHMCTVPDGELGGDWMEVPDCRPGFTFEKRASNGWDCYAKDTRIMDVTFYNIQNVPPNKSSFDVGLKIPASEFQKFENVMGQKPSLVTAECWMGKPGNEPASASPKALMEADPTDYSGGYRDVVLWDKVDKTSGNTKKKYTCIFSIVDDQGGTVVYEGSNDPPFKVNINHQSVEYGSLDASWFMVNDNFVFDYSYPSGTLPSGDYFNEDPTSEHAFPPG